MVESGGQNTRVEIHIAFDTTKQEMTIGGHDCHCTFCRQSGMLSCMVIAIMNACEVE